MKLFQVFPLLTARENLTLKTKKTFSKSQFNSEIKKKLVKNDTLLPFIATFWH